MKEKMIRNVFKTTSILMIMVVFVVTVLLLYFYSSLNKNEEVNAKIHNATININSMVKSLNSLKLLLIEKEYKDYTEFMDNERVSRDINGYIEHLDKFLSEIDEFDFSFDKNELKQYPELLYQTNDERVYIINIGDLAREINTFLDDENLKIKHLSSIISVGAFIMLLILMIVLAFSYFFQEKHFKTVDNTINSMNDMLDGKKITLPEGNKMPDSELLKRLKEIDDKIAFQNNLLNYNAFGTLETILPEMYPILKAQIDMQRMAVAFLDSEGFMIAETLISENDFVGLNSGFKEHISDTTLGKLKTDDDVRVINDLATHYKDVNQSEATKLILSEGFLSSITAPMYTGKKLLGFIFINNKRKDAFSQKDIDVVKGFAKILKSEIYNSYLMQELVAKTSTAFADLVEKKDNETGNHLIRVASYSKMIAEKMMEIDKNVTPKMIREILWFAPLHDIGKVGIPDKILLKPGRLTQEEYTVMKEHVNIGIKVIDKMNATLLVNTNISFLDTCIHIIAEHHEKWDGSGYPKGLKGDEISIPGRIIAVADVFDALISKRVYKDAFSFERAMDIIKEGRGKHFNPLVVDIFLENQDEVKRIIEEYKD